MKKIINLIAAMTLGAVFAGNASAQAAAPANFYASPAEHVGSVELTWDYQEELLSGGTVYIQYAPTATPAGGWSAANAQIKIARSVIELPYNDLHQQGGLRVKFDAANANANIPYYFYAWMTSDDGSTFSTVAASTFTYPQAPTAPIVTTYTNSVTPATATIYA
ncbi:MAG: hypothetical protein RQ748_11590, partial [Elusimicrobiales bacterium]|nr:hypothetical protein [Elusimicrobiales bacterium]